MYLSVRGTILTIEILELGFDVFMSVVGNPFTFNMILTLYQSMVHTSRYTLITKVVTKVEQFQVQKL